MDKLLSNINASRKDLVRECIKKVEIPLNMLPSVPDIKYLPYCIIIEYKPIFGVKISKQINYAVNYKDNKYIISPDDYNANIFNPKSEDLDEAFMLLLKCGLIRPLMIFRDMTRYVLSDERLNDLIHYLRIFRKLEYSLFEFRSELYDKPKYEETQRLKFFAG